jgi:hypothetical protein
LYLAKAQNLFDLPNLATARTNLSVYSQAQTYTKTEVDAKTTVASTAQAQAWSSNTTLMTPLRLAEAFQGSNQVLSATGYQKLPGGLIIQWGSFSFSSGTASVVFPLTYPNSVFVVTVSDTSAVGDLVYVGADTPTASGFTARSSNGSDSSAGRYITVGR